MDTDWPAVAEGPRCERCGQAHVPLPASGRFGCGRCGWPLVPREVQQARQARARRVAGVLLTATVVAVGTLLARSAPDGRAQSSEGSQQPQPGFVADGPVPIGPPGAEFAPAGSPRATFPPAGPMMGGPPGPMQTGPPRTPQVPSAHVPPGPPGSGGYRPGGFPPGMGEAMMGQGMMGQAPPSNPVLAELERSIAELERTPPEERDTHRWNMAAGDHYWLHARESALASASAPRGRRGGRAAQRLREDRFVAGYPQSQDHLQRAQLAYERSLDLAATREERGRAHQRLGDLLCAQGEFAAALKHAEQARKLVGNDARTQFLRARCLPGLGQPREGNAGTRGQAAGEHAHE